MVVVSLAIKAQSLKPTLNFSTTQKIIEGCIEYAKTNQLQMAIAVYDRYGQLINFVKMDGVSIGTSEVARWKGKSASIYQYTTEETEKWNAPMAPEIATIPGGVLIKLKDGYVIGSIGVSGAAPAIDVQCAVFGLKKVEL